MTAMTRRSQKDIFSLVVSDITSYTGDDPLRPWIQGIQKIHQSLPAHVLDEKLPRFLQKCVQIFESDVRYQNDSRYLAVWIQLMDYVDDAKVLLKKMEAKKIGVKRAKFYIAYALYYEKKKRFMDAEKMYQLGVQNLAGPIGELHESYDKFLHRMNRLRHRRARVESMPNPSGTSPTGDSSQNTSNQNNYQHAESYFQTELAQSHAISIKDMESSVSSCKDDLGWSRVDDNTDMNEDELKLYNHQYSIEEIEGSGEGNHITPSVSPKKTGKSKMQKPFVGGFKILADDDDEDDDEDEDEDEEEEEAEEDGDDDEDDDEQIDESCETKSRSYDVRLSEDTVIRRLKEDTVIRKFIGSTGFDEPKIENACHHGLVDPTVNLKQAMDDINDMFGEPLNFVRARKQKKQDKKFDQKLESSNQGFFILADDDIEKNVKGQSPLPISHNSNVEADFFEPTIFTKEAMNEINDLFGKSLDF